jgi:hypothetical protein
VLFRVKYSPDSEAKVVIENTPNRLDHAEMQPHHHPGGVESDLSGVFHFLHFYDAIKENRSKKKYFLTSEATILKFLNKIQVNTGGDNPLCPSVGRPGGLFD